MRRYEAFTGEAMHFGVPEGQITPFLEQRGFCDVVNVTGEDLKRLYFTGVNSARRVASVYAIARAQISPTPSALKPSAPTAVRTAGQEVRHGDEYG